MKNASTSNPKQPTSNVSPQYLTDIIDCHSEKTALVDLPDPEHPASYSFNDINLAANNIACSLDIEAGTHTGAALIDSAATFLVVAKQRAAVPTINFRTDFLKPAKDTELTAKAIVRRLGRTVAVVDVDLTDKDGNLIAVGRGTFGSG